MGQSAIVHGELKKMKPVYHKFNAVRTERNGIKFHSKKEAEYYDILCFAQQSDHVLFFIRQPKFDLPGGVTYTADFMVFYTDGRVQVIDVKGYKTKEYIAKKKMVEAIYPIEIEER